MQTFARFYNLGPLRLENGNMVHDPKDMADIFVDAFASVYSSQPLTNPFPHQQCSSSISNLQVLSGDGTH